MELLSNYSSPAFIDLLSRTKDEAEFFLDNFKLYLVLITSKNHFLSLVLRILLLDLRLALKSTESILKYGALTKKNNQNQIKKTPVHVLNSCLVLTYRSSH